MRFVYRWYEDLIGIGGGLSLCWNEDLDLEVSSFNQNLIDTNKRSDKRFAASYILVLWQSNVTRKTVVNYGKD